MPSQLFEQLQERSKARGERGDCTVKAWAVVADLSYDEAHADLAARGRRTGKGVHMRSLLGSLTRQRGLELTDVTMYWRKRGVKTVTSTKYLRPGSTYLVFVKGHVLAIKGGEVHDWTEGRKFRVNQIFEVSKV